MRLFFVLIFCFFTLPGFCQEESEDPGQLKLDAPNIFDEKVINLAQEVLENNPLANTDREEVKKLILDKYKGSLAGTILSKSPRILDICVDILRDKKALARLMGIFTKQEQLKLYMYFWIGLIIGTWLFKKYLVSTKTFLKSLSISLFTCALAIFVFYSMFNDELSPTLEIIAKHILN